MRMKNENEIETDAAAGAAASAAASRETTVKTVVKQGAAAEEQQHLCQFHSHFSFLIFIFHFNFDFLIYFCHRWYQIAKQGLSGMTLSQSARKACSTFH